MCSNPHRTSTCARRRLVREVYGRRKGSVDPVDLVKRLGALGAALGEDFTDGGQHDCEEVLSAIMDRLHEDLVRPHPAACALVHAGTILCCVS